jgi:hypothetical protein
MARIASAQLCEMAFLDNCDRLCMVGVTTRLPVPTLPLAVHQLMIAARVVDVRKGESLDLGVSITMPNGMSTAPDQPDGIQVNVSAEYVLITLRQIPLLEEGVYRFAISLGDQDPVVIDVPVLRVSRPAYAAIH